MNKYLVRVLKVLGMLSVAAVPTLAFAVTDAGDVATQLSGQYDNIMKAVTGASYIAAAVLGITAIMKFKKYAEDPRDGMKAAILYAICAAVLAVLPTFIAVGTGTIFGTTSTQSTDNGVTSLSQ